MPKKNKFALPSNSENNFSKIDFLTILLKVVLEMKITHIIKGASMRLSIYNSTNILLCICLLHKMLKKTKITTNINCIVNSTYTISYLIGVRPVL